MMTTIAAGQTQYGGWGNPVALILAALVFWGAVSAHRRWKQVKTNSLPPAKTKKAIDTVKPQVKADSDSDRQLPSAGGGEVVPLRNAAVDTYVTDRLGSEPPTDIVRGLVAQFGMSEATAWRALRRVRDSVKDGVA